MLPGQPGAAPVARPARPRPGRAGDGVRLRKAWEMARRLGEPQTLRAVLGWHRILDQSPDCSEERLAVASELVRAGCGGPGRAGWFWPASGGPPTCSLGDIAATAAELQARRERRPPSTCRRSPVRRRRGRAGAAAGAARRGRGRCPAGAGRRRTGRAARSGERVRRPARRLHRHRGEWDRIDAATCIPAIRGIAAAHRADASEARVALTERPANSVGRRLPWPSWPGCSRPQTRPKGSTTPSHHSPGATGDRPGGCFARVRRPEYLGQSASLLARHDDAESHFQAAHRLHARLGSPLWDAYTFADHARMLLRRNHHGDRDLAVELAAAASRDFRLLGMTFHERRVDGLSGPAAPAPAVSAPRPLRTGPGIPTRASTGRSSTGGGGPPRDSKGLRYLAARLRAPGREHHALDLVAGGGSWRQTVEPELVGAAGDAGPVLDAKAKSAYRARLAGLREELGRGGDSQRSRPGGAGPGRDRFPDGGAGRGGRTGWARPSGGVGIRAGPPERHCGPSRAPSSAWPRPIRRSGTTWRSTVRTGVFRRTPPIRGPRSPGMAEGGGHGGPRGPRHGVGRARGATRRGCRRSAADGARVRRAGDREDGADRGAGRPGQGGRLPHRLGAVLGGERGAGVLALGPGRAELSRRGGDGPVRR